MTTLHDVFEVVDVQDFRGQEVLNVYFYEYNELFVTTNPTYSQALAEGWVDQIMPTITGLQSADLTHTAVRVRNLYDPADAFEIVHSEPGLRAVGADSNFDAFAFQLGGETSAVRKGAKRIAGVPDDWVTDGIVTDSTGLGQGADVADVMEAPVMIGLIIQDPCFIPVLVKRVRSGSAGNYTYELPTSQADGIKTRIINVLFEVLISTQVSRKIGLGS